MTQPIEKIRVKNRIAIRNIFRKSSQMKKKTLVHHTIYNTQNGNGNDDETQQITKHRNRETKGGWYRRIKPSHKVGGWYLFCYPLPGISGCVLQTFSHWSKRPRWHQRGLKQSATIHLVIDGLQRWGFEFRIGVGIVCIYGQCVCFD